MLACIQGCRRAPGSALGCLNDKGTFRDYGAFLGMARDHWVQFLSCRRCQTSGVAVLSTEDKLSWAVQVESVPEGFRVKSENGSNFCCSARDRPVEP
jgi:hypothetical protein